MSFLEVHNLTHNFSIAGGKTFAAINNISFSLEKGEILGIIGHTGSGKSTLVSHLNGLLKPDFGKILFNGEDIWKNPREISKIRSKIGLVFQYPEYQLFEETVYDDIAFGPKNMGLSSEEINIRINNSAKLLGFDSTLFEKSPFDLSGGQKRRVAIAGVMAMEPEIIVFDEPTAGLDPIGRQAIFTALNMYRKEHSAAVIIISHSMEDMAQICDKILVLNKGNVFNYGTAKEIFLNPKKLREIGLNVPMISEVFNHLSKKYKIKVDDIITVDDAINFLVPLLEQRRLNND